MLAKTEINNDTKIIVVGGNAAGLSVLSQLRRHTEAEITLLERGPHIGYASCGLPYYVGGTIRDRNALLPLEAESLQRRFGAVVRTRHEVVAIDPSAKLVQVKDLSDDTSYCLRYDKLVLTPGARAIVPSIAGTDLPGVFTLQTVTDVDAIRDWLSQRPIRHVTVVGGGFIGIEAAENLRRLNLPVTLIERAHHIMGIVDPEISNVLHRHMVAHGTEILLGQTVTRIDSNGRSLKIVLDDHSERTTDAVVLAIGVAPETTLARQAGLKLGSTGAITVDEFLRTSDPDIYAIGDAVEIRCAVSGQASRVALAGPLARQARIAAAHLCAKPMRGYRGELGTFICKAFDLAVASTGLSEMRLKQLQLPYQKVFLPLENHVRFYPGLKPLFLKILFHPSSGTILGAQAIGEDGVDKRIDVLATAITAGMTMANLEELPLSYAPSHGAPRDAINLAGALGAGIVRGAKKVVHPEEIKPGMLVLDIRDVAEYEIGTVPGAIHIANDELRARIAELPTNVPIVVCCQVGLKANAAQRFLELRGFDAYSLMGGYTAWKLFHYVPQPLAEAANAPFIDEGIEQAEASPAVSAISMQRAASADELDVRGLTCPGPIVKVRQRIVALDHGQRLTIYASDPAFPADFKVWCKRAGHTILNLSQSPGECVAVCEKGTAAAPAHSCSLVT